MTQRIIKRIENLKECLLEAKQNNSRFEEERAFFYLGNAYQSPGDFQRAIEYHEKDISIAKDVGDRAGEGRTCCNLGNAYHSLQCVSRRLPTSNRVLREIP